MGTHHAHDHTHDHQTHDHHGHDHHGHDHHGHDHHGHDHHGHDHHGRGGRVGAGLGGLIRLVLFGLLVTAVVKELRVPADQRSWHGTVAGFVPYDLRRPTVARFKERLWNPESERLIGPHVFGVGWSPNVGRIVALARERVAEARA